VDIFPFKGSALSAFTAVVGRNPSDFARKPNHRLASHTTDNCIPISHTWLSPEHKTALDSAPEAAPPAGTGRNMGIRLPALRIPDGERTWALDARLDFVVPHVRTLLTRCAEYADSCRLYARRLFSTRPPSRTGRPNNSSKPVSPGEPHRPRLAETHADRSMGAFAGASYQRPPANREHPEERHSACGAQHGGGRIK